MKHSPAYGPDAFQKDTGVSRETLDRLRAYADLLVTWNKKLNLIGDSTIDSMWWRHMLDSAQLYPFITRGAQCLLDVGSGAGFPGLVLAIMGVPEVHLVESDQRKAAFLREAARIAKIPIRIHAERIEDIGPFLADVITARALAPLKKLLEWTERFQSDHTVLIFPKGQNVGEELTDAHKMWRIVADQRPSRTDPAATILCINEVRRVRPNSDQPAD